MPRWFSWTSHHQLIPDHLKQNASFFEVWDVWSGCREQWWWEGSPPCLSNLFEGWEEGNTGNNRDTHLIRFVKPFPFFYYFLNFGRTARFTFLYTNKKEIPFWNSHPSSLFECYPHVKQVRLFTRKEKKVKLVADVVLYSFLSFKKTKRFRSVV